MMKSGVTQVRKTELSYLSLLNQMTLFITCTKYIYRLYGSPPTNFYGGSPYNFFSIYYNYLEGADSKSALFFKEAPIPKLYLRVFFFLYVVYLMHEIFLSTSSMDRLHDTLFWVFWWLWCPLILTKINFRFTLSIFKLFFMKTRYRLSN